MDGIDNLGPDDFATVQSDPNLQLMLRPALNVFYVGMNNTFPPFDDVQRAAGHCHGHRPPAHRR